jgi:hypothetical protein
MTRPIACRSVGSMISGRVTCACATSGASIPDLVRQTERLLSNCTDGSPLPQVQHDAKVQTGSRIVSFVVFSSSLDRKNLLYEVRHKTQGIYRRSRKSAIFWCLNFFVEHGTRNVQTSAINCATIKLCGTVRDQLEEHLGNELNDIGG